MKKTQSDQNNKPNRLRKKQTPRRVARFAPPKFRKIWRHTTLPVLAVALLACCIGTWLFVWYAGSRETVDFDSVGYLYEYMFHQLNSRYAAGEDGMSYAAYQKQVQFYLRHSGEASALYDAAEPEDGVVLLDSSEEKLFVTIDRPDGTTRSLLSCDARMDPAYYDFLAEYQNSEGRYHFRIQEVFVNWETWEFIPVRMYLSRSFDHADEQSIYYENPTPAKEGFERISTADGNVFHALLPGTVRTIQTGDRDRQDWCDARVASLDHLRSLTDLNETAAYTVTYTSSTPGMLSAVWRALCSILPDSVLSRTIPVALYDETGNLKLYSLCQEHRFNISRMHGVKILLGWLYALALCISVCSLIAYGSYAGQKSRWEQESYRRNLTDTLAHDLKSPLMAISGYAENLKEKVHPEKEAAYTDAILECVAYMNRIVSDMLELERLEQTRVVLALEPVRAERMFSELAKYYQTQMEARKLRFSLTGTCLLKGDPRLLRKAFDNLFNNAVNYTPEGGEIQAVLSPERIVLKNTGVSLTEEMCRKVFEPFVKEDQSRSGQKGTGLGLSIVRQILDAHGMSCRMESGETYVSVIVEPAGGRDFGG